MIKIVQLIRVQLTINQKDSSIVSQIRRAPGTIARNKAKQDKIFIIIRIELRGGHFQQKWKQIEVNQV